MPVTIKYGSTKRYGARYGRRIKEKLGKIELERKAKIACPYCSKKSVKRESSGIWFCKACTAQFTGFAYSLSKPIAAEEETSKTLEITRHRVKEVDDYQEEEEQQADSSATQDDEEQA